MKSQDKRGITSKKIQVMHPIILKGFVFMIHTIYTLNLAQSAVINCPDNSARITCSTSVNFTSIVYTCPCGFDQHCLQSGCIKLLVGGHNASIVNRTQTELTILSAEPRHEGNWSCSDIGGDEGKSVCNLILTKIPSVTITSDVDADSVNLGNIVTLTVDIGCYYCSGAYSLTLQVGSVNYTLGSGRNNTNRNLTETIPINMTQTHLGDVKLDFACDNHLWNITPEGVQELQQNIPKTTSCDITSDKDTETLTLHEEVTLTVNITTYHDIRGSYCSTDSDFTLQTGDVTHLLNVGDHGLQAVAINVTKTHLGGVRLVFNCQDKLLIVSCDGVTELYNKIKATAEPNTVSTPILIAGVIGALLFLSVVINIACAVKR